MNNPGISIIIPVFNARKWITNCIKSVISQTCTDWELLIVDDGSTDGSAPICDEYAGRDSRIKVFHQPNRGVNLARAKGVDNASGEYFVFLDADDTLSSDALVYMLGQFSDNYDLLVCGKEDKTLNKEEYLNDLWTGAIAPALWGKMFRASLYKQMDYAIDRRLVMGEDLLLNSMYALGVDNIKVLPREVYLVNRGNESSVTRTFKHDWEYEKLYFGKVQELFLDKCSDWDSYGQIKLLVNKSWLNAMKYVMLDGGQIDYKDLKFKEIRDFFDLHKDELGPSEKLIFKVKSPAIYRMILKTYIRLKGKK